MKPEELFESLNLKGRKLELSQEAVKLMEQWVRDNPNNEDKQECITFVRQGLVSRYRSIITQIVLSIIIQFIVKFVIDRLFTSVRSQVLKEMEEEVKPEVDNEVYFDDKYLELEE